MIWLWLYLAIGFVLAMWSGIHMMVNTETTWKYRIKAMLGLLFGWPVMLGYVLLLAAFFLLTGGLF